MTFSNEHCPTCEGSGFVGRKDQRSPCPTCSPRTVQTAPIARGEAHTGNVLRIVRWAAWLVGAVALMAVLAVVFNALWH
jgi:hypothetical protein